MSVPEQVPYKEYRATGSNNSFEITFYLPDPKDLVVMVNKEIPLVGAYSIVGDSVVFSTPPNEGDLVELTRDTQLDRETNFKSYDNSFRPETINFDLDKIWLVLQESNLVDAKILARLKQEIEWRRTHDFNYDELAQVREKQLFDALKGYTDTLLASTNPGVFQGVIAGVVFARDGKSIQTHLEEILESLAQERENIDLKADQTYVEEQLDLKAPQETTYTKLEVDSALSAKAPQETTYTKLETDVKFSAYVGGRKGFATLALAQAAQSTLPADTVVDVTNDPTDSNNGTYQWNGTTLTKSAYDPLNQANSYTDQVEVSLEADATTKANAAEANANTRTGIIFDFYSLFDETQFFEVDKNFRIVREIKKGYKPGSGSGGESNTIVLDFYSNFKDKSSVLVVISNNNKVLLRMASDGSEIFNANNLKNNVSPDVTHIEHTFLKKRLAEHPIAAKFNYHHSNDGTVAKFPSLIQVYEMYDELMSRHSDSMTKITLGTDATGLPIYCYIIKPQPYLAVGFSEEELKHPKVVISGGVHGNERPAQIGCVVFTAQLLDEHMKRERYATLRHACEFHIIPAINPWGANNFNRVNSNGVDINRDFGDGLFVQAESQLMRDYVLPLDNVMLFLDMHQSQSPDYLLWLGATRPKSRELTKAFGVESLKYFYANVRPEATTQYSFQMAVNGDNTMCQYFSNQGIESVLIESPVSHEAIGDATVVRDFVTETYAIAINEFYQNFKQINANTAI